MIELTAPSVEPPRKAAIRQAAFRRASGIVPLKESRPSISLLIMAKNEGDTLERCVESALPLVDQVVIGVDDASDDRAARLVRSVFRKGDPEKMEAFAAFLNAPSRLGRLRRRIRLWWGFPSDMTRTDWEIEGWIDSNQSDTSKYSILLDSKGLSRSTWNIAKAIQAGVKDKPVQLVAFQWRENFSQVRNDLKERCTGEWILWLDGHEYLTPDSIPRMLRAISAFQAQQDVGALALKVFMEDEPAKESLIQPRLVRNRPGPLWERAQHNRVIGTDYTEATAFIEGAVIVHDRPLWVQNMRKPQRITHGLKVMKWWKGETYYAGATAHDSGHNLRAVLLYLLHLRRCDNPTERARVWVSIARVFKQWGSDRAFRWACFRALADNPAAATAWVNLVEHEMERAKGVEPFEARKKILQGALEMARYACTLSLPKTGVGILEAHYTWGPRYQAAKICFEAGMILEARNWAVECLQHNPPREYREELESNLTEWTEFIHRTQSDHSRDPGSVGNRPPRLLIIDRLGQFSGPIGQHFADKGWHVRVSARTDAGSIYWADSIYCDWADGLAVEASRLPLFGRQLVVHMRSYELYGNTPREIDWEQVSHAVFEGAHVEAKARVKFDLERFPNLKTVTIPNAVDPAAFRLKSGPFSHDIVTLSFLNHKKGIQLLAQAVKAFPDWTFHVGGYWQDEMLSDYWEHFLLENKIDNVRMFGAVSESEKNDFLQRGSVFLSTSIKEGHAFAALEAAACGLHVVSHDYPGSDPIRKMGGQTWTDLSDLADILKRLPARHAKVRGGGSGWKTNRVLAETAFPMKTMLESYERIIQPPKEATGHAEGSNSVSGEVDGGDQSARPEGGAVSGHAPDDEVRHRRNLAEVP